MPSSTSNNNRKKGQPTRKKPEPDSSYSIEMSTSSSSTDDSSTSRDEASVLSSLAKENFQGEASYASEEEVALDIDGGIVRYPASEKDRSARQNVAGWQLALGDNFVRHGHYHRFASALLTEFLASLFAAFFYLLVVSHLLKNGFFGFATNVLLVVIVFAIAHGGCMWFAAPYSGGIINPLIALTVLLTGHMSVARAIAYMAVEVIGTIAGVLAARGALGWNPISTEYIQIVTCGVDIRSPSECRQQGGIPCEEEEFKGDSERTSLQQFAFELTLTWAFLLLVYTAAFGKQTRAQLRSPLAVAIIAAAYASLVFLSTSVDADGGSFIYVWKGNPALCLATSIAGFREDVEDTIKYEDWTWIFGSILGAVLASIVVLFLRPWKRTWPVVDNARL